MRAPPAALSHSISSARPGLQSRLVRRGRRHWRSAGCGVSVARRPIPKAHIAVLLSDAGASVLSRQSASSRWPMPSSRSRPAERPTAARRAFAGQSAPATTGIAAVPVSGIAGSPEEAGIFLCGSLDDAEFLSASASTRSSMSGRSTLAICRSSLVPTGGSFAAVRSKLVGSCSFSATGRRSHGRAERTGCWRAADQSSRSGARTPRAARRLPS